MKGIKAIIKGQTYDTAEAENLTSYSSPDGDDYLYRMPDGRFFLVVDSTFLDGIKLRPSQSVDDIVPELAVLQTPALSLSELLRRRVNRVRITQRIVPLTEREALVWCVKTQIPECFMATVLESI